jgi:hypothetical protein
MRCHFQKFSMEKLRDYLRALGYDVNIRIQEEKKKRVTAGQISREFLEGRARACMNWREAIAPVQSDGREL